MPIKGLTDRNLSFPEIGQIRKGGPKGERTPGKDLDYFRVEFAEKEASAAQLFRRVYGDKPTDINIILPFNETERMWDAWLEAYTAGRMVARSDGEKFIYLVDTKTGQILVRNGQPYKPYTEGQIVGYDYQNKPVYCKATGRLKVIVPELARAVYMTVLTTSVLDIANISAQLEAFRMLNNGQIAGIPFVLRRRPKKISVPGKDKQRVRMTKWLISIEADPEWVKAKLVEVKHMALPGNGLALLPDHIEHEEEIVEASAEYIDDEEDTEPLAEAPEQEAPALPAPPPSPANPLAAFDLQAQADITQAFWGLQRHIKFNKDEAAAIVKTVNGDFKQAYAHLRRQAETIPPA